MSTFMFSHPLFTNIHLFSQIILKTAWYPAPSVKLSKQQAKNHHPALIQIQFVNEKKILTPV